MIFKVGAGFETAPGAPGGTMAKSPARALGARRRTAKGEDRVGAGMARWRREFPDIDCSGKGIVGRLLHLNGLILKEISQSLARHGMTYPEFAILATLRVEGAPFRMSPKALLNALILTSGGLSNLLRKLERQGLVRRTADAHDGRGVIVELTPDGVRAIEPAMRDHARTELAIVSALSAGERANAVSALGKLMMRQASGDTKPVTTDTEASR